MDPVNFSIFQEICRWGAYENQQKSRNRPDFTSTLRFLIRSSSEKCGVNVGSGRFLDFSGNLPNRPRPASARLPPPDCAAPPEFRPAGRRHRAAWIPPPRATGNGHLRPECHRRVPATIGVLRCWRADGIGTRETGRPTPRSAWHPLGRADD